ncbi:MAG: hypothetical protein O7F70_01110, partial [Gemmatimonadetes bacterium]|nr:hypothetical protein [Gemmatimonadota bacterium]
MRGIAELTVRRMVGTRALIVLCTAVPVGATAQTVSRLATDPGVRAALATIDADDLRRHVATLASDEFEGRGPASRGEELTIDYLATQFRSMGLAPGNPNGTYLQSIPLVVVRTTATVALEVGGDRIPLAQRTDVIGWASRGPQVSVA